MRIRRNFGKCTRCGSDIIEYRYVSLFFLRGILTKRWTPPRWCSGCRIDSAQEAMEAKQEYYRNRGEA